MASPSPRRSQSPTPARHSPAPSARRSVSPRSRSPSRSRSRTPQSERRNGGTRSITRSRSPSRGRERSRSISRSRSRSITPPPRSAKIVVEKLTKTVNEDHLREIFGTYGTVQDIDMPINTHYNTNRGTAYILFSNTASAEDAIAHMHEAQIDGAPITVSIVLPRRRFSRSPPPRTGYEASRFERERPRGGGFGRGSRGGGRFRSPDRGGRRSPRGGGFGGRGGGPPRGDVYYPPAGRDRRERSFTRSRSRSPRHNRSFSRSRSYSRTRSPPRRRGGYGRRESPPRDGRGRGGAGGRGARRRSRSYDSYSSRSRSYTRSRSRDRGGRRR